MSMKKVSLIILLVCVVAVPMWACGENAVEYYINSYGMELSDYEVVAMANAPAYSGMPMNVASGEKVKTSGNIVIDYSNTADGYVMIKYTKPIDKDLKVQVAKLSGTVYTYTLPSDGEYAVFPFTEGSGDYSITVYKNISGGRYSTEFGYIVNVKLKDAFAPYLVPNQYVNYTADSLCVKKAEEITAKETDELNKVGIIYDYVINNITYDKVKAMNVSAGYIPDLDAIFQSGKGICFDYSSMMTAMLRSQGIPSKMIFGYSGSVYHAWINVYTKKTGWIDGVIFFDGTSWKLMDPTFASKGKSSEAIMSYIGDGTNYTAMYSY